MSQPTRLLLVLAVAACSGPRDVSVRVLVPDLSGTATPASGVPVVAIPYDRDSVIAALEAAQATARPHVAALDSLFARFRGPFLAHFEAGQRLEAVRDSVTRGLLDERAAAASTARLDSTRVALEAARRELAGGDSLRAEVRRWENSTYRSYDSVVRVLAERARRRPVVDTTDAVGIAQLTIPASQDAWWVTARVWDVTDPNMSWTWSVRVEGDSVTLDSTNARRRPRY